MKEKKTLISFYFTEFKETTDRSPLSLSDQRERACWAQVLRRPRLTPS